MPGCVGTSLDEGGARHAVDASLSTSNFQCSICFELLLDPVVGSCGHDFCLHCISAWKEERQRANKSIQCPICRAELCSPLQPFGVCIRIRETIDKLFPEQSAIRRRDVEQSRLAASAHVAALNASSHLSSYAVNADAELQASFSTYADAYRQLSQNLLSLIARQQEAAMGQQFQQQHQQLQALQQMHSASLRANLQGSLQQVLLRPPAHPTSSTTSSSSTATALSQQQTQQLQQLGSPSGGAVGADDMQVDALPPAVDAPDVVGQHNSDMSVDASLPQRHVHIQQALASLPVLDQQSAGVAAFVLQLAHLQQQQQQTSAALPDSQAALLYQQHQEVLMHWYASLLAHQQQAAVAAAAATLTGAGNAAGVAGPGNAATVGGMPRAVLNSWMVPAALTSEADLMRLYASLQSRIQTCERLLCMSGHADMVAARQAADAQHSGAGFAATAAAPAATSIQAGSMSGYLLYMQQLQAQQVAATPATGFSFSGQGWQQQQSLDTSSGAQAAATAAAAYPGISVGMSGMPGSPRYTSSQLLLQERIMMQRQLQQQQAAQQQVWWQRQQQVVQAQQQATAAQPDQQQQLS